MSIDQKAQIITDAVCSDWEIKHRGQEFAIASEAARRGIIEGLEMAAKVAESFVMNSELEKAIAAAIRSLK